MARTPKLIEALPDLPEGRVYVVIGNMVWGRSASAAKAWQNARSQGGAHCMDRTLVYEANEGRYVTQSGMEIANEDEAPDSRLVMRVFQNVQLPAATPAAVLMHVGGDAGAHHLLTALVIAAVLAVVVVARIVRRALAVRAVRP